MIHLKFSGETIVEATLIAVPSSTKNRAKARDPEMHSVKKRRQGYFGMKVHIGVESRRGLIHHAGVTAAKVPDAHEVPKRFNGDERRFYGDGAYRGRARRKRLKEMAPRARNFTHRRAYRKPPLTEANKATNRREVRVRAKVEPPFLTLKRW
jgi:IS5 family transposase